MQEADEQDTCRICSAPAEPDQPLFHPCKCSGTIRYIHQDCLTTWLAHSKKKNCDVCKHPYSFTKVYAPDMPSSLPPVLLVRRLLQHAFMGFLFIIRAIAVATIWLGVLPWLTVWTWRMYFAMGESTAWWISNRPRPSTHSAEQPYSTIPSPAADATLPPPPSLVGQLTSHPLWLALSADIFTGQIIASLIVLTFVAVFLLREWIAQNARPGVFEEEEVPPENRPAAEEPAHHGVQLQEQPQPQLPEPQPHPQAHPQPAMAQPAPQAIMRAPRRRLHLAQEQWREAGAALQRDQPQAAARPSEDLPSTEDELKEYYRELSDALSADIATWDTVLAQTRAEIRGDWEAAKRFDRNVPSADVRLLQSEALKTAYKNLNEATLRAGRVTSLPPLDPLTGLHRYSSVETEQRDEQSREIAQKMMERAKILEEVGRIGTKEQAEAATLEAKATSLESEAAIVEEAAQRQIFSRQVALAKSERPAPDPLLLELRRDPYIFGPPDIRPVSTDLRRLGGGKYGTERQSKHPNSAKNPFLVDGTVESNNSINEAGPSSADAESNNNPTISAKADNDANPFPTVVLQPPKQDIPFSLRNWHVPPSAYLPPEPTAPVRPPLPPTTTPFTFSMDVPLSSSPSLALFRAPEQLETNKAPVLTLDLGAADLRKAKEELEKGKGKATEEAALPPPYEEAVRPARARPYIAMRDDDHYDGAFGGRSNSKGKRRQLEYNESDGSEEDEADNKDDVDVDMEAESRRYFRDRDERDKEPVGLMLDMDAYRRDFPHAGGDPGDWSDDDSDDTGTDLLHLGHGLDDREFDNGDADDEHEHDRRFVMDDEGPWEDIDDEEDEEEEDEEGLGVQQIPGGAPAMFQAPLGAGQQAAGVDAGLEGADEVDGNVDDEMEGVLEAVGLRGPVFGVFQNAALMILVLDTAIGLGIWLPFTIGKTAALLSLDPRRMMQVLHLPIRAMRIVTDPIVDLMAFILVDWTLPWALRLLKAGFIITSFVGWNALRALFGDNFAQGVATVSSRIATHSANVADHVTHLALQYTTSTPDQAASASNATLIDAIPDYLGFTEPYFEALGKEVRISATKAQATWIELALGSEPADRVFAVSLGYIVAAFILSLYLNLLTVGNARTAGLAVRNAVRQQLLVLKVAAFIFIELVTFPLGCGIVLDLCTVWMFPEANLQSRIIFFTQAPLTAMFYHWVAGTMFMYSFAVLLSGCRSVMRPGAMWFIKDPQDQNSHPIRDILDRPTLTQLRKICVSGMMYTFVVACVVGSVAALLFLGSKSIMPFRWKKHDPLSNVPVDLLFLQAVLPYTMHYFRPKRGVKAVTTIVWKFLATRLRLTSYFFGGRYPQEEFTPNNWMGNFVRGDVHVVGEKDIVDGSFRRVPATDNLALPRDMRATAVVTADGEPVDEENKKLMDVQNSETEKAKKDVKQDYTIVYMPPHFRYRIIAFIALLWTFSALLLGIAVAFPIAMGRSFFRLFTPRDVHDGYALIVGFYLIWACYLVAKAVDRLDKRRQRRSGDGPRANLYVVVLKRGLLWLAKMSYMVFFLGIVIPILLAVVIDLYMVLPFRFTLDPDMVPRIRVVDEWALGLMYAKIMMHAHAMQPPNRLTRGLNTIMSRGWTYVDPVIATKEVIAPLTGGLLGMILLPGGAFRALQHFFPDLPLDNRFVFMHVYPAVFIFAGSVRSAIVLGGTLRTWSQAIRDKEFLVEMRLKNHEPGQAEGGGEEADALMDVEMEEAEARLPVNRPLAALGA